MVSYSFDGVPADDWERFKDQVPRSQKLDDALIRRIQAITQGECHVTKDGKIHVGKDWGEQQVEVYLRPVNDDGGSDA